MACELRDRELRVKSRALCQSDGIALKPSPGPNRRLACVDAELVVRHVRGCQTVIQPHGKMAEFSRVFFGDQGVRRHAVIEPLNRASAGTIQANRKSIE